MKFIKSIINLILCSIVFLVFYILLIIIVSFINMTESPSNITEMINNFNIYDYTIPFIIIMTFLSPFFLLPLFFSVKRYFIYLRTIKKCFTGYYREIPCDGNIIEIYYYSYMNNIILNKYNIINTFIIKWYYEKNIKIINRDKIELINIPEIEYEKKLFQILFDCTSNNILSFKKLNKYMEKNYETFELWHINFIDRIEETLTSDSEINLSQIVGFVKYLQNFSSSDSLEIEEVHMWEEYMLVASMFGLTKNIQDKCESLSNIDLTFVNPYYQSQKDYQTMKRVMNHMSNSIDNMEDNN